MKHTINKLPNGAQEIIMYQGNIFYEYLGTIYKKTEAYQCTSYEVVSELKK